MFGVLDRYIGRTILNSILMTLFLLVSLSGIIKFVEQLRKVGDGDYTALGAGVFTLLSIPKDIDIFFPMAALLGALLGLGALASRSELVVMQASGFTRLQIALSVMKTAIPLVIVAMFIGEWVAPAGDQWARNYRAEKIVGNSLVVTNEGMWAKDGRDFIHIQRIADTTSIQEISIYRFDEQHKLKSVMFASSGAYDKDNKLWVLSQVDESILSSEKKITGSQRLTYDWKTNLTPEKLGIVSLNADSLSIRGLYQYISYLKESGQVAAVYQLSMWKKILAPLSAAVMMLMAVSFIFGPLRTVPMGVRVVSGIVGGFLFYILNQGFGNWSLVYSVPPIIAALLPSILFLGVSIVLLVKRK
ncbi:LPS export ABC transporter permease LptG [Providencia stuartii]|uniref:LPS export ABC transporter permease LptG n=3 Tax=Morganellaceae TaxID=1903414 RepID=A0A1S1HQX4_PROST|nr:MULTISPECIES: LPS export ABC transporter permease LptG [Providencia]MDV5226215.1 LPS export ABC transporter permease LptG [Providencia rettgeri]ELR5112401.1 LPS export ABC transporter permease LptG [Providencia stuartii]ELR5299298.1 LPS export ABC transporter permease LptG [Providencia stuartii]MDW7588372.1 LPS export ABC transporter permease LptG [Providencia sp. 2023EL-00965]OHT24232.1 LPS export ABC transporter permease LptG [Providencia stuartii]